MRVLLPIVSFLTVGAAPNIVLPTQPATKELGQVSQKAQRACRDGIVAVRKERGLGEVPNEKASPDRPLLIYAVDKRIAQCAVMVMHGNLNDIRPLPESGEAGLMPAR